MFWSYSQASVTLTYDRTVDESREFFRAVSEIVADWRKCQYNVQVFPDELDEVLPAVLSIWHEPLRLDFACHVVHLTNTQGRLRFAVAPCVVDEKRHSQK